MSEAREEETRRHATSSRPRKLSSEAALIERTLLRLELHADGSPLGSVIARAFALAIPGELAARDLRLLQLADEVAATGTLGFRDHARLYLALAASSWAKRPHASRDSRDAALIAAVALASLSRDNIRAAMGVRDELAVLGRSSAFDERVRELALGIASEKAPEALPLERVLPVALAQIESRFAAEVREKPVRRTGERVD